MRNNYVDAIALLAIIAAIIGLIPAFAGEGASMFLPIGIGLGVVWLVVKAITRQQEQTRK
ncbi:hypothetical protein SAMN06265360_1069 [Haloechinothrix alba]|uniref:Uncharacterized protein n=1 Tax=Haloechinothrix alba TaxID=664784 RepID=A0A238WBJ5_9PSEU|nr:hypothetical protein [Haloechinothrix alba]SNR43955.1 hypothetical protein SAMN06265360_1069 [Haloechinothrix alba]